MPPYPTHGLHYRNTGSYQRMRSKQSIAGVRMHGRALHDTSKSSAALNIAQAVSRCLSKLAKSSCCVTAPLDSTNVFTCNFLCMAYKTSSHR